MSRRPQPYLTIPTPPGLAARRQETARAKAIGGRRQPGSGNKPGHGGDVRTDCTVEELKLTTKQSYALRRADLQKVMEQALAMGRIPVFLIEFRDAIAKPSPEQWILIPAWHYADLTNE